MIASEYRAWISRLELASLEECTQMREDRVEKKLRILRKANREVQLLDEEISDIERHAALKKKARIAGNIKKFPSGVDAREKGLEKQGGQ